MKTLNYDTAKYKNKGRKYTVEEVSVMAEVIGFLGRKVYDADKPALHRAWEVWNREMVNIPHVHSMSLIGPYCYACHCDMDY